MTAITFGTHEANKLIQPALKPCPFCGEEKSLWISQREDGGGQYFFVKCGPCEVRGPWHRTKGHAIEAWNTRPNEVQP